MKYCDNRPTRAREHLLLTGTKPPSEYLADFDVD